MVDFSLPWSFVCQNALGLGNTSSTMWIPCNTPTYTYNSYKFLVAEMHTDTACGFDWWAVFRLDPFLHRSQFHYVYFYPCQLFLFTHFGHVLWIFCKMWLASTVRLGTLDGQCQCQRFRWDGHETSTELGTSTVTVRCWGWELGIIQGIGTFFSWHLFFLGGGTYHRESVEPTHEWRFFGDSSNMFERHLGGSWIRSKDSLALV